MEVRVEIFHLLRPSYEMRVFVDFTGNWVGMEVRVDIFNLKWPSYEKRVFVNFTGNWVGTKLMGFCVECSFLRERIWLITWRPSNFWSLGIPLLRSSSLHTQIITECDWPCAASCLSHQPGWAQGSGLVAFCMPPVTNGFYPWKLQILQSDHIEAITIVSRHERGTSDS